MRACVCGVRDRTRGFMCWSGPHSELGGPFQFFGVPYHGFLHLQPARVTFDVTSVVEMGPKEMRKRATPAMAAAERIIGLRALEDCLDTINSGRSSNYLDTIIWWFAKMIFKLILLGSIK